MKPNAILVGDLHLNDNVPEARIDDFTKTREEKINWILELQKEYENPPIIQTGDIFENWRCSHELISWFLEKIPYPSNIITIPGNHDLPSLNIKNYHKSPLRILFSSSAIHMPAKQVIDENDEIQYKRERMNWEYLNISGFPWGVKPINRKNKAKKGFRNVAICHYLVYIGEHEWPGIVAEKAKTLLRKLNNYDLIVSGHNHKSFVEGLNGRLLVNPGSIFRAHADQFEHFPRVYLYYAKPNIVEPVYIPIKPAEEVLTRIHLQKKENKERMSSIFVRKLNEDYEISISFKKNLQKYFKNNPTGKVIEEKVWEAVEK